MLVSELESYPPYYEEAYKKLPTNFPLLQLLSDRIKYIEFYREIPDSQWTYSYAEGKWSIKKLVRHILDAELIFCFRALSTVRGEQKSLMGWDPDAYAETIDESSLIKDSLLTSLKLQMRLTLDLFTSFSNVDLKKIANANGFDTEVAAMGFSIIAHEMHHRAVISDKYLSN
jgi:uncharacterized damage-inducible protein DinB